MPVTPKLSRRFYEVFGDAVVNELVEWFNQVDTTYRADLLRLNQFNADRYDAKLEQRFAEFELRINRRFSEFEVRVDQRFVAFEAKTDQRFVELEAKVDQRFVAFEAKIDQRFIGLEAKLDRQFAAIDRRFTEHGERFTAIDRRFNEMETKFTVALERTRADIIKWMFVFWAGSTATAVAIVQAIR